MGMPFLWILLAFAALRLISGGRYGRGRRWERSMLLEEKVAKLETVVADLQEQIEQDRVLLGRLEEERDFLRQLYPAKEDAAAPKA